MASKLGSILGHVVGLLEPTSGIGGVVLETERVVGGAGEVLLAGLVGVAEFGDFGGILLLLVVHADPAFIVALKVLHSAGQEGSTFAFRFLASSWRTVPRVPSSRGRHSRDQSVPPLHVTGVLTRHKERGLRVRVVDFCARRGLEALLPLGQLGLLDRLLVLHRSLPRYAAPLRVPPGALVLCY